MDRNEDRTETIKMLMNEFQSREWADKHKAVKDIICDEAVFDDQSETSKIISDIEKKKCEKKPEKGYFG